MADSMASAVSLIILYFSSAFLVKTIKSFSVHFHTHAAGGLLSSSARLRAGKLAPAVSLFSYSFR